MAFGNLVNNNKTATAGTTAPALGGLKKPSLGGLKPPSATSADKPVVPKLGGLKLPTAAKPVIKPATEEDKVPVVDEVIETLTDEKVEAAVQEAVATETPAETTEEVAVAEEPKVVEEVKEEEVKEEVVPETAPEVEIIKETLEPPAADTEKAASKRKSSGTKKASTSKEAKADSEGNLTKEEFEIMEAEMNFCAFDEEFEARKDELIEMANAIEIPSDVTPGQVISLIADLDNLNREVWVEYFELKTRFTNLTALKPEGKIERIKRINRVGKNDTDRERNGLVACQSYNTAADVTVDLLAYQDVLRYRYNFFQSIFDYIATKRQMLITVQACLKTESNL